MRPRSLTALRPTGWPAWLATCASFAVLCAAIAYWAMILAAPRPVAAPAATEERVLPRLEQAGQLFGVPARGGGASAAPSNLKVLGIVAAGARGVAILSVDGKPGRPFAVGDAITPAQTLAEVRTDAVVIEAGGMRSDLPSPSRASLAVLTAGAAAPSTGAAAMPAPGVGPSPPPAGMPPMPSQPAAAGVPPPTQISMPPGIPVPMAFPQGAAAPAQGQ